MDKGECGTVMPGLQTVDNPTGRSGASVARQTVPNGLTRPGLYLPLSLNHLKQATPMTLRSDMEADPKVAGLTLGSEHILRSWASGLSLNGNQIRV